MKYTKKVLEDRHLTVREIAAKVGISIGLVHSILTENLRMRRVSAKRSKRSFGWKFVKTCWIVQAVIQNV